MRITVNGKQVEAAGGTVLADYVEQAGYRLDCIAIELNGRILPKEDYAATELAEGDVVEVVTFMGGGC